jgi:hypothetical protein
MLQIIKSDIEASRLGSHTQTFLLGLLSTVEDYLPQLYTLLPAVIDKHHPGLHD